MHKIITFVHVDCTQIILWCRLHMYIYRIIQVTAMHNHTIYKYMHNCLGVDILLVLYTYTYMTHLYIRTYSK